MRDGHPRVSSHFPPCSHPPARLPVERLYDLFPLPLLPPPTCETLPVERLYDLFPLPLLLPPPTCETLPVERLYDLLPLPLPPLLLHPPTCENLPVERLYDLLALLARLHARESDAPARAVVVAQDPRRDDVSELREHRLEVALEHVRRQVRDVQVGRVLLLLLEEKRQPPYLVSTTAVQSPTY